MTIEQAIKKAIEGGYPVPKMDSSFSGTNLDWVERYFIPRIKETIFLDPQFWQALYKDREWFGKIFVNTFTKEKPRNMERWLYQWHKFIDHLASGGQIETFFEKL